MNASFKVNPCELVSIPHMFDSEGRGRVVFITSFNSPARSMNRRPEGAFTEKLNVSGSCPESLGGAH